MKPITWIYVGAVVLLLMAACGLGLGGFIFLGSLGGANVGSLHIILAVIGILAGTAGIILIFAAVRKTKADTAQNVTLKVDLPGDVNVEKMKCQSCGGVLTSDDIKMVNGAPMVTCPFCKTVYQLTEEPKW
jgi:phage FluMu protein Com